MTAAIEPLPIEQVERELYAIAAAWELGAQPPVDHPVTVYLLDVAGVPVSEIPAVNAVEAVNICRAAGKAGWATRTTAQGGLR